MQTLTKTLIPIRITSNGQFTQEEFMKFIHKHTAISLVLEYKNWDNHTGPHYHGWITNSFNISTLRKWIQSELHCKGNEHYSLSSKKKFHSKSDEYYKYYCCKSTKDHPPHHYYNISITDVNLYWKNFWECRDQYKIDLKDERLSIKQRLDDYMDKRCLQFQRNPKNIIREIILFYYSMNTSISNSNLEEKYHYYRQKYEPEYLEMRVSAILEKIHR